VQRVEDAAGPRGPGRYRPEALVVTEASGYRARGDGGGLFPQLFTVSATLRVVYALE
jgi:hypothetical protein